jgi:hypothetical protein
VGDAAVAPEQKTTRPVVIETSLPTARDNVAPLAFDGKLETFFRSDRAPNSEDRFTLAVAKPVKVKRVEVLTGRPDGADAPTTGVLEAGVLEASPDGQKFDQVATFESGIAKADLGGREIKALRIRPTRDGTTQLAIREIVLDSQPPAPVFKYPIEVHLDASEVPEMKDWCERSKEIVEEWYPIMAEYLGEEGYTPPCRINLTFRKDMKGIAGTSRANITCGAGWFKAHPDDYGAIVHEAIHVVQNYRSRGNPGWLVEGIADYVRWFMYEPPEKHPRIRSDRVDRIKYTDSYQTTAAFFAWLVQAYDKDLVKKLNKACRKGEYKPGLFREFTGKDLDTLFEEFKQSLRKK